MFYLMHSITLIYCYEMQYDTTDLPQKLCISKKKQMSACFLSIQYDQRLSKFEFKVRYLHSKRYATHKAATILKAFHSDIRVKRFP